MKTAAVSKPGTRVAVFGGAFDPPHVGHATAIAALLHSGACDEVWVVPSAGRVDKPAATPAATRLELTDRLLRECFPPDAPISLLTLQIDDAPRYSTTVELFARLREIHPNTDFYCAIGSELIDDLAKWHDSRRLAQEVQFLVLPRPGELAEERAPGFNLRWLAFTGHGGIDVSSTEIREMLAKGRDPSPLIPPLVLRHIADHRLYGAPPSLWGGGLTFRGRYLTMRERNGWEFVARVPSPRIAVIVPVTSAGELIFVEQWREPVNAAVVEFPAGIAGDQDGAADEPIENAAKRELLEETGYQARKLRLLLEGPPSAGLTSEEVTFILAEDLVRIGSGGGVGNENITVHIVRLDAVDQWLCDKQRAGVKIDPKVYAGLYFVRRSPV